MTADREPEDQILAAAVEPGDDLALELGRDLERLDGRVRRGSRISTALEPPPARAGARPRRTLSTSGSSGTRLAG